MKDVIFLFVNIYIYIFFLFDRNHFLEKKKKLKYKKTSF